MASRIEECLWIFLFIIISSVFGLSTTVQKPSSETKHIQNSTDSATIFVTDNIEGTEKATATTLALSKSSNTLASKDAGTINPTSAIDNTTLKELKTHSSAATFSLTKSKRIETEYEELPLALAQKDTKNGYTRDDGTYIIEDSADTPCILAYFKSKITVYYPTDRKKEKYTNAVVTPPDDVEVSGSCDRDSVLAILDLTWEQGVFSLRFSFDDLTDSWYVDQFSFVFNTSMPAYSKVDKYEPVTLKSIENKRFWMTSHARSFRCLLLHDVSLIEERDLYSGTIHFDEARVQAFTRTENFKTPKHCIHRVHRDEMVPVTVGGVLAGLTLLTVAVYGAFRYFKIKKFQYGTME